MAILLLSLGKRRVLWVKYAGNWKSYPGEPWSYAFQRWWLKQGFCRGVVTINGRWPDQPEHTYSLLNPSFTDDELAQARKLAERKVLASPFRLLFVGSIKKTKGVGSVLRILARLQSMGFQLRLDLAGDGPDRGELEQLAATLGIDHLVKFHGWIPQPALTPLYAECQIIVLPSVTEGWPKALSEGMAYGTVPIASNVGSIPQYLKAFNVGKTFGPSDLDGFTSAIANYLSNPALWKLESERATNVAQLFSYTKYVEDIWNILEQIEVV